MRIGNVWLIGVVMVAALGGVIWWSTSRPGVVVQVPVVNDQGQQEALAIELESSQAAAAEAAAQLEAQAQIWMETDRLAASTPRIQLSAIVAELQKHSRETKALTATLPKCFNAAGQLLVSQQQHTIDGYIAFLAQDELTAKAAMEQAATAASNYRSAMAACSPPA